MPTPRNPHARMDLWRAKDDGSLYRGEGTMNLDDKYKDIIRAALEEKLEGDTFMGDPTDVEIATLRGAIAALTAPAQPHSAGVPEPLIVDEPDEFGVIRIWPFGREPFLASVDVITNFFERDGSISGTKIRYGGYPTSVDGTRRYAQALLKACEIAEQQRPGSD